MNNNGALHIVDNPFHLGLLTNSDDLFDILCHLAEIAAKPCEQFPLLNVCSYVGYQVAFRGLRKQAFDPSV